MPPFKAILDFGPTEEQWTEISPPDIQVSVLPMALERKEGEHLPVRILWQASIFKRAQWTRQLAPDCDFTSVDPMARVDLKWPPILIIHAVTDHVPCRDVEIVKRAGRMLEDAGVKNEIRLVNGAGNLFDHVPGVGTTNQGSEWR